MKAIIYIFILSFLSSNLLFAFSGKGAGTEKDPYQITTINQLQEMNDTSNHGQYWILMNDIDAAETKTWNIGDHDYNPNTPDEAMGFEPINISVNFFDGNYHIIKNLFINDLRNDLGLFVHCELCHISRLGLIDCDIRGGNWVGSICGFLEGSISKCFATGKVKSYGTAGGICGGFLGSIEHTYSLVDVSAALASSFSGQSQATAYNEIKNCYAVGIAIGQDSVMPVFAGNAEHSVWNVETTNSTNGGRNAIGLTTSEMKKHSTFLAHFEEFDNFWCIDEGTDYPKLRGFGDCPTGVENGNINNNNYSIAPNPASDFIEISYPSNDHTLKGVVEGVRIYNIFGEEISTPSLLRNATPQEGNLRIDVSSLPAGVYFVRVEEKVRKFVKM